MTIQTGKAAPAFSLPDQDGKTVSLASLKGKWVVLYFYPRDDTAGCTIEAKDFTALLPEFEASNAVVLGVSRDNAETHCAFAAKYELKLTLLTDADHAVHSLYDAWTEKGFMGNPGVVRSTVLINPNGVITHVWPKVQPIGHAHDVLKILKESWF